jgi:hypothetical protein
VDSVLRGDVPDWLARSPVFCRVPAHKRARLDRAILLPAEEPESFEEIARKFKLTEEYGISTAALRTYARKLDELIRPTVTSHVMAGVLSCLPKSYRRKLMDGSEVMLISRVLNALDSGESRLETAELAKLGSILAGIGRSRQAAARVARAGRAGAGRAPEDVVPNEPIRVAESVRQVYGLPWPPDSDPSPPAKSLAAP